MPRSLLVAVALLLAAPSSTTAHAEDASPRPAAPADLGRAAQLDAEVLRLFEAGRHADALPLARESLAIREKALPAGHADVATSLLNVAAQLLALGSYADARVLDERALAILEKARGPESADVALALNNLAEVRRAEGAYADARPLYERALAIDEKALGPDHPDVATDVNNLASLCKDQGEYAAARTLYGRALSIREKALGTTSPYVAQSLNNLAILLIAEGSPAEARPLCERAIRILEDTLGAAHPYTAQCLGNLASLLSDVGEQEAARAVAERVLALAERLPDRDRPEVALALGNLGAVLFRQEAYAEARPLAERTLALAESKGGARHPDVAVAAGNLANVRRMQGDLDAARPLYERAVSIDEALLGTASPLLAMHLDALAALCEAQGRVAEALALHQRALSIAQTQTRTRFASLGAAQRLSRLRAARAQLDDWLDFAARTGASGHAEALRFRGLVARAETADRVLARRGGGEERTLYGSLQAATRLAGRLANEAPSAGDAAAFAAWQRRYAEAAAERERLARAIAERSAPLRGALERLDLGEADVRAALAPREALVEYLRVRDRYVAWIVRAAGGPLRLELGAAEPIEAASEELVAAIESDANDAASSAAVRAAGAALRARIWSPVDERLGADVDRVVVCPDAALASVPFVALPGRRPGGFLLDDVAVAYVSHPFDLVPRKDAPTPGAGALVIGGVDYDRADATGASAASPDRPRAASGLDRAPRGDRFTPLPATRAEAESLRRRLGADVTTLLAGADATEARTRAAVRGKRIVHIATHGFSRDDLFAGLYVRRLDAPWTSADVERQLAAGHDPMLLSGLALAGANPRDGSASDDGILTALEASYLDLDGVDLVTLSACDTAKGTAASGEGVLGLVSAFSMAGARRVLASLWRVDDEATRRLMDGVYERILRKESPLSAADALREAATALRDARDATGQARFAAPRYWAAFVAYGR